jgi:hypothetical protein
VLVEAAGAVTPAIVAAFAAETEAAAWAAAAATVAALSGVPPLHPGSGQGNAGPSDFEFVKSLHVFAGAGGVRAMISVVISEFPSSIGWTCRFMRKF